VRVVRYSRANLLTNLRSQVLDFEGSAIGYSQLLQRLCIVVEDLLVASGEPLPVDIKLVYPSKLVSTVGAAEKGAKRRFTLTLDAMAALRSLTVGAAVGRSTVRGKRLDGLVPRGLTVMETIALDELDGAKDLQLSGDSLA
jgi:hypothetical protein